MQSRALTHIHTQFCFIAEQRYDMQVIWKKWSKENKNYIVNYSKDEYVE